MKRFGYLQKKKKNSMSRSCDHLVLESMNDGWMLVRAPLSGRKIGSFGCFTELVIVGGGSLFWEEKKTDTITLGKNNLIYF